MRRALLLGLLAVALLLTGCLRDPDPLELDDDSVTVHSILVTGSDSALVVLTRAASRTGWDGPSFTGVRAAEVRLIAGEDTTWLPETPEASCISHYWGAPQDPGAGCYRAILPAPIAAGATYQLEIRLADGTRITGQTTAPPPVTLSAPAPDLHITVDCGHDEYCWGRDLQTPSFITPVVIVPAAWEPPASVVRGNAAIRSIAVYLDGGEYPGEGCDLGYYESYYYYEAPVYSTKDGLAVPNIACNNVYPALSPARFDSIRAELYVMGWNAAYYDYLTSGAGQGVRAEAAAHGIAGAFGVFGAMSRTARTVMLVRDPPPAPAASPEPAP